MNLNEKRKVKNEESVQNSLNLNYFMYFCPSFWSGLLSKL